MPKGQRVIVFLVTLLLLYGVYFLFKVPIDLLGDKGIVLLSALVMLSFTTLFAEHYFTRPTDVVASTVSILLLLAPMHASLEKTGIVYWIFFGYNATILILALVSLLLLDSQQSNDSTSNRLSAIGKGVAVRFGSGRFLWFSLFAISVLFYVDSQSSLFLALFAYSAVLLLIDPKKAIASISMQLRKGDKEVATLFSIQSGNAYLARALPSATPATRFDLVCFRSSTDGTQMWRIGLVVKTYELNAERWMKILTDVSIDELEAQSKVPKDPKEGRVYLVPMEQRPPLIDRLAGIVCEYSTIDKLKFEFLFNASVQEGDLLEVRCADRLVLYQVVEGVTGTEALEARNEAGVVTGEAIQLGSWDPETRSFLKYGWVPALNSPVYKAQGTFNSTPSPNEYQIGTIPGTTCPVFIDRTRAVTHHLAILGVTGTGKSVFARNLIRQLATPDTKIICVDFTNEYRSSLSDLIQTELLSVEHAAPLFSAVDTIGEEMEKFANQRNKGLMTQCQQTLRNGFHASITNFINGDSTATLFELPDVTNSAGILDYTKWFFKTLFEMARASELSGKRICIVLEEAHTIIPEWNFLGTDDKRATSVVNSISQIALQGRKYGVGFIVIAQRTANVSKTVLTQCNSIIAFQQFDRTSSDFLGNYMGTEFVASLPRLLPRQAIAVGMAFSSGTPVIFRVPDIEEPGFPMPCQAPSENPI